MFLRQGKKGAAGGGAEFSFIGPEVTVTGNIDTPGRLHVDGQVVGDVRCGILSQGERGRVEGNIAAGEARLAGLVDGAVEAGTLALDATARVTGDVLYETLSIAGGGEVEGRFKRRRSAGDGAQAAKAEAPTAPVAALFPELPTAEAAE